MDNKTEIIVTGEFFKSLNNESDLDVSVFQLSDGSYGVPARQLLNIIGVYSIEQILKFVSGGEFKKVMFEYGCYKEYDWQITEFGIFELSHKLRSGTLRLLFKKLKEAIYNERVYGKSESVKEVGCKCSNKPSGMEKLVKEVVLCEDEGFSEAEDAFDKLFEDVEERLSHIIKSVKTKSSI